MNFLSRVLFVGVLSVATAGLAACGSSSSDTPTPSLPIPELANGSFETGDFSGWVTQDLADPLAALAVDINGATEGLFGVETGFDGDGGPMNDRIFVAQDIDLTGVTDPVGVRFDWAVPFCDVMGMQDRSFSLVIEPAGGGAPLLAVVIHTCTNGASTPGGPINDQVIDISAVANQNIRIKFEWLVPEDFTGPAQAYLDDVALVDPTP